MKHARTYAFLLTAATALALTIGGPLLAQRGEQRRGRATPGNDLQRDKDRKDDRKEDRKNDRKDDRKEDRKDDRKDRGIDDPETRPIRYSFPTPIAGVDLGRTDLERAVGKDGMDGRSVAEKIFEDFELLGWANVIRNRLGSGELTRMNKEIKADLPSLIRQHRTDRALAKALDDAKVDARDFHRALRDVFEDWRGTEVAAYLTRQGYSERWLAARMAGTDRGTETQRTLERLRDREIERPTRMLDADAAPAAYADLLELWMGLPGRPSRTEIEYIFREHGVVLTPEVMRVLNFGDAKSSAAVLERAGISRAIFVDQLRAHWRDVERDREREAKQTGEAWADRMEAELLASQEWLQTKGPSVVAVYEGRATGGRAVPVLGSLEGSGADAKSLADLGITESLAGYFAGAGELRVVLYTGDAVRAKVGNTRYEGKWDRESGRLDLVAVYGGQDRKYESVKLHGGGLLLELSVAEVSAERAKTLLRRTRRW